MDTTPDQKALLDTLRAAAQDERAAVEFLESRRWGASPACPKCGSFGVYTMKDAKTGERNKDNRWRCRDCERMFTVRTGTVMEESRLSLRVWVHAFWRACASKKGVSALQIKRETGISYQSALFLMHRIRKAMDETGPNTPKLAGIVEVDETYVGGKPRYIKRGKRGRGTKKARVIGMIERGGDLRYEVTKRLDAESIGKIMDRHIERSADLMTDDAGGYIPLGKRYASHSVSQHKYRRFVSGNVTTNTIEGAFSLLKRGVYGTFHYVSKKHLPRYCSEFEFRWNTRKMTDAERAEAAIKAADGKRLTYEDQVNGKGAA